MSLVRSRGKNQGFAMNRVLLEDRRLMAESDLRAGIRAVDIARNYGVTRQSVYRWRDAITAGISLAKRPSTGRPASVPYDQLLRLWKSERSRPGDMTGLVFAALIREKFGVAYHHDHCRKLMRRFENEDL